MGHKDFNQIPTLGILNQVKQLFFLMFSFLNLIHVEIKCVRVMIFKLNSNKDNVGY